MSMGVETEGSAIEQPAERSRRSESRLGSRRPLVIGAVVIAATLVVVALVVTLGGDGDDEAADTGHLVAGGSHTCALRDDGGVACWGHNRAGGLGDGSTRDSAAPVAVDGIDDAVAVTAGSQYTCALRDDGSVACWGWNAEGRLGDGSDANRSITPVAVEGIDDAIAVSAGWAHACAVGDGGAIACWGSNADGQLGSSDAGEMSAAPVAVEGIDDAVAVSAGAAHSCALREGGRVSCWGSNVRGQLGDGTPSAETATADVAGLDDVVGVSVGAQYSCAVRGDGRVWCWGSNAGGRLGDGSEEELSAVPVQVEGIDDAVAVSAGWAHACVLRADERISCWGSNAEGRLGDGTGRDRTTPVPVIDLDGPAG